MIGLDLLARFNFIYDYSNCWLILEPNHRFDEPFEYNMTGLTWRKEKGTGLLHITAVYPGSAGEKAGVDIGDRVLKINGRAAADYDVWELIPLLKQEGAEVDLEVEREGVKREVKLRLERVI